MRAKRPNEISESQTSGAVCPTSVVMTSHGYSTSILEISSTPDGGHSHTSVTISPPLRPSNFPLEKTTRYREQISDVAEKKIVKRKGFAKLKTVNPELDNIADDAQGNLLKVRQILHPEMRNWPNEEIKDFEQNCPRLTFENSESFKTTRMENGKCDNQLRPEIERIPGFRRTTLCNPSSDKTNSENHCYKLIPSSFELDNLERKDQSTPIRDESQKMDEVLLTSVSNVLPVSETTKVTGSSPKAYKGSFLLTIAPSTQMAHASHLATHKVEAPLMPLALSHSPTRVSVPSTSNMSFSSSVSHLSSPNHRFSLTAKKGKFGPLTRALFSALFTLLTAIPAFAKGPDESSITSNNVFGGFSRLSFEQQLFLQDNHTTTKAQSGATAALHCALSAPLADGLVSWVRRRDYHLLTVGRQVYSSDQRVGIKVSPDGSDWVLTIRWVSSHDAGQYECQVSSHPPQALMVNLSVVEAHAEILGGKERYIHSGSSLRLVCLLREATESPVYVFWYRGDRMINYDKEQGVRVDNSREASILYVTSVTGRDEGNYTCLPSNASPASVTVHVVHKENPAHLQQETNTEKESNPSSSSASASSSSLMLSKSSLNSTSSSKTILQNCCCRHFNLSIWTMVLLLSISILTPKMVELR